MCPCLSKQRAHLNQGEYSKSSAQWCLPWPYHKIKALKEHTPPPSCCRISLSSLGMLTNCSSRGRRVTIPEPRGRKSRPTRFSRTELLPELWTQTRCNHHFVKWQRRRLKNLCKMYWHNFCTSLCLKVVSTVGSLIVPVIITVSLNPNLTLTQTLSLCVQT